MESDRNRNPIQHIQTNDCFNLWRNWSGFWLIGLCNNFAYVVMLSAAQDILKKQQFKNTTTFNSSLIILDTEFENLNNGNSSYYDCSSVSTAAVLLADIFPTLIIKISAPLVIHKMPHGFRILFCVIMAATSFLVVSFSSTVWMSILGVIFASTSSGFGELTFLSLTVFYNSIRQFVGDVNAHSPLWDSDLQEDARCRTLNDEFEQSSYGLLNEPTPTCVVANCSTSPDVSLASLSIFTSAMWTTETSLSSDHLPIVISFEKEVVYVDSERRTYINFRRADWENFTAWSEARFANLAPPSNMHSGERAVR